MPYHPNTIIPKGELGEFSKILEETLEMQDAVSQGVKVLILAEMVDIIGAITLYTEKHYPCLTLDDLVEMSKRTRRAYEAGEKADA